MSADDGMAKFRAEVQRRCDVFFAYGADRPGEPLLKGLMAGAMWDAYRVGLAEAKKPKRKPAAKRGKRR